MNEPTDEVDPDAAAERDAGAGASYTLPANPLSELGADDVDRSSSARCSRPTPTRGPASRIRRRSAGAVDGGSGAPSDAVAGAAVAPRSCHRRCRAGLCVWRRTRWSRSSASSSATGCGHAAGAVGDREPAPAAGAPAAQMTARVPEPEIRPMEAKIEAPVQKASPPRAARPARQAARPQAPARAVADLEIAAGTGPRAETRRGRETAAPEKAVARNRRPRREKVAWTVEESRPRRRRLRWPRNPRHRRSPRRRKRYRRRRKPRRTKSPRPPAGAAPVAVRRAGRVYGPRRHRAEGRQGDLDHQIIGRNPIDGARVPCGPAKVTIDRERWQTVTLDVNAQAGNAAVVRERLRRPRGTLIISWSPPGAQIIVNRVAAGTAPRMSTSSASRRFRSR